MVNTVAKKLDSGNAIKPKIVTSKVALSTAVGQKIVKEAAKPVEFVKPKQVLVESKNTVEALPTPSEFVKPKQVIVESKKPVEVEKPRPVEPMKPKPKIEPEREPEASAYTQPVMGNPLKKIGDFVSDVGKTIAYSVAAPVNSVTGHQYKPEYKTKVGAVLGQGSNVGIDSIHIAGKSFVDTISGGLGTKAVNVIRRDDRKEKPYQYTEMKNVKTVNTGVKAIDKGFQKYQQFSKGGALVIGSAFAGKSLAVGAEKVLKENKPENVVTKNNEQVSTSSAIGIAAFAIAGALLLR